MTKVECFHKWKWFRDGDGNLWLSCTKNCGATINLTELRDAFSAERYIFETPVPESRYER